MEEIRQRVRSERKRLHREPDDPMVVEVSAWLKEAFSRDYAKDSH
jgi:hypothetical protein